MPIETFLDLGAARGDRADRARKIKVARKWRS